MARQGGSMEIRFSDYDVNSMSSRYFTNNPSDTEQRGFKRPNDYDLSDQKYNDKRRTFDYDIHQRNLSKFPEKDNDYLRLNKRNIQLQRHTDDNFRDNDDYKMNVYERYKSQNYSNLDVKNVNEPSKNSYGNDHNELLLRHSTLEQQTDIVSKRDNELKNKIDNHNRNYDYSFNSDSLSRKIYDYKSHDDLKRNYSESQGADCYNKLEKSIVNKEQDYSVNYNLYSDSSKSCINNNNRSDISKKHSTLHVDRYSKLDRSIHDNSSINYSKSYVDRYSKPDRLSHDNSRSNYSTLLYVDNFVKQDRSLIDYEQNHPVRSDLRGNDSYDRNKSYSLSSQNIDNFHVDRFLKKINDPDYRVHSDNRSLRENSSSYRNNNVLRRPTHWIELYQNNDTSAPVISNVYLENKTGDDNIGKNYLPNNLNTYHKDDGSFVNKEEQDYRTTSDQYSERRISFVNSFNDRNRSYSPEKIKDHFEKDYTSINKNDIDFPIRFNLYSEKDVSDRYNSILSKVRSDFPIPQKRDYFQRDDKSNDNYEFDDNYSKKSPRLEDPEFEKHSYDKLSDNSKDLYSGNTNRDLQLKDYNKRCDQSKDYFNKRSNDHNYRYSDRYCDNSRLEESNPDSDTVVYKGNYSQSPQRNELIRDDVSNNMQNYTDQSECYHHRSVVNSSLTKKDYIKKKVDSVEFDDNNCFKKQDKFKNNDYNNKFNSNENLMNKSNTDSSKINKSNSEYIMNNSNTDSSRINRSNTEYSINNSNSGCFRNYKSNTCSSRVIKLNTDYSDNIKKNVDNSSNQQSILQTQNKNNNQDNKIIENDLTGVTLDLIKNTDGPVGKNKKKKKRKKKKYQKKTLLLTIKNLMK